MFVSSTPRRRRRTCCTSGKQATTSAVHIKVISCRAISPARSAAARYGCAATTADRRAMRCRSPLPEKRLATKCPAISTWESTSARNGRHGGGKRRTKNEDGQLPDLPAFAKAAAGLAKARDHASGGG